MTTHDENFRWECPLQDDLATLHRVIDRIGTWLGQGGVDTVTGDTLEPFPLDIEMRLRYTALIASDLGAALGPDVCRTWFHTAEETVCKGMTPLDYISRAEYLDSLQAVLKAALDFAGAEQAKSRVQ